MKRLLIVLTMLLTCGGNAVAGQARILEVKNRVQAAKGGGDDWAPAVQGQLLAVRDRVNTGLNSLAAVRLTDLYTLRMAPMCTIEITPALVSGDKASLDILRGAGFIFSREKDGEIDIRTPAANGAMRGTQVYVRVSEGGRSEFQVLEGMVELSNPHGRLTLHEGEAGEAQPGATPRRTAKLEAKNLLQWALYYPAVVAPADLGMTAAEQRMVAKSLDAYREGDLVSALEQYPDDHPGGGGGRLYKAAMMLTAGKVDDARRLIRSAPDTGGRRALERMIAAVLGEASQKPGTFAFPGPTGTGPGGSAGRLQDATGNDTAFDASSLETVSEAMAESYWRQSAGQLENARLAALRAVKLGPDNGYAWTRLGELEFSSARTGAARAALARSLELTPRNAQAHALHGFILAADNRIAEAGAAFGQAIALDGALGNGWLGLGLTKIKQGDKAGGRADLQTASTVEPTASVFHSYLGKALSSEGRREEARKDLDLARRLDPHDPTPWLYSAIELQQRNRTNEAIEDLEESIRINDNRRLYRSRFLLDQDRAVRSANLARIYQAAGMTDVAVREATRAVESDYTNASAHLFLSNSYNALRDPRRIALRYETPWFNELLLANMLSPVGGGPLSQYVSQQEYSKLLEADGLGGSLTAEWRETDEMRSTASLFGTRENLSWGLDAGWRDDPGQRLNAEAELAEIYGQMKWQVTPGDTVYFLGKWADQSSGDNFETWDHEPLSPGFDFTENQEPGLLLLGWNHQWAPGSNTLMLAGRLSASQRLRDPAARQLLIQRDSAALRPGFVFTDEFGFDQFTNPALRQANPPPVSVGPDGQSLVYSPLLVEEIHPWLGAGAVVNVASTPFDFDTWREWNIYSAEVQHIEQREKNTFLAGARRQSGSFDAGARLSVQRPDFNGGFSTPAAGQRFETDFDRLSLYAYDYWQPARRLLLAGGLSWDRVEHPDNFRNPPVTSRQRSDEEFSGKLGFTATLSPAITLRGAWTQGLGGVTYDESVRLEPVQVAGFNQAWRTILSESIAGSVEAPRFETMGLSLEGRLASHAWWGISGSCIEQAVDRTLGVFTGSDLGVWPVSPAYFPDSTEQLLNYDEESMALTLHQSINDEFSVGAGFRRTRSTLHSRLTDIPVSVLAQADTTDEATLDEFSLYANWNSSSGFFVCVEAGYFDQKLEDDPAGNHPVREGDRFWQFNALAGYRWSRNLCEISAGVLNIGGSDYRLSPLNPYPYLERDQTIVLRCRLSF